VNEPSVSEDPTEIARWGTDDARREDRRTRELQIADRMAQRRRMAAEFQAGGVEIPRDRGFVFADGARFSDVPPVVAAAREVFAAAKPEKRKEKSNKQFMMKLLKQNLVTLDSPFMRLALHPDILAPVGRYLGVVPILQFVNVYFSCDSGDDLSKSQLYHCDSDDAEQVKVWVLVEDVTPETGPLTLLPAAESDLIRSTLGYTYDLLLNDVQVSDVLGGRNVQHQFVGPSGTVGFIDTSRCFHFGSRFIDRTKSRLIVMLQYLTPLSFIIPTEYWEHARYREFGTAPGLDDLSRMVLGTI
jgi:hypothetical protein